MGQKGEETRTRLLDAASRLLESGGYFGAGLNQVIAESGAPRGSLYFHFPGGKDQLVSESVRRAGRDISALITGLEATSTADLLSQLLAVLGDRLERSAWHQGCPVATVALELSATNDAVQQVCSEAYQSWEAALRDQLLADGHPDAEDLATTVLALIEGGLLLARAHRSRQPLIRVSRTIKAIL
ncbi:TetR/AcrR family transcriptional regulator [Longispora albida]|uniref:TetR/AcrR family transcriptional regulator n=1 Tax=Longispora albida TaxID=203523 RepID=UPI0003750284|nr:TetR/AcrR family transcriptional regulator [Longispora albida]